MISICIPIYNFNVSELVKTLSAQLKHLNCPSEIILIDDCSEISFKKANENICSKENYIQLDKNMGRAAIRNRFLKYAKYEHLLFLDCDMVVNSNDFLEKYYNAIIESNTKVICGGLIYQNSPPKRTELLRWKYGIKKESRTFKERNQNPHKSFMTSNFIIPKSIFDTIRFDERLNEYGHEDTLFGYELKKRNFKIIHIGNPVLSKDIINNIDYISNTEKAIGNLIYILQFTNYDKGFIEDVKLLHIYYKFYKVRKFTSIIFVLFKPLIKYALTRGYVSLYVFDFYKLGTLTLKMKTI
jgi:glycosyltransferase involved in cell wall biosynthesis